MNKKGHTLIEIVVAFAIGALFITSVASILSPVYRSYDSMRERSDAREVAQTLLDKVRSHTDTASSVTVSDDGSSVTVGSHVISTDSGFMTIDGALAYDSKYYNGKTAVMSFAVVGGQPLDVRVSISVLDSEGIELCSLVGTAGSVRKLII